MKIFGFQFGKDSAPKSESPKTVGQMAFSTPFLQVGEGNLSMPYITRYYTSNGYVMYGTDNLYPQLLNQLYYTSPIHSQCIEFITNAIIGGGYSWKDESLSAVAKVDQIKFERSNKFSKLTRQLTRDYVIHRRVAVIVHKKGDKIVRFNRVDPSTVRNYQDLSKFAYSSDWSRGWVDFKEFTRYNPTTDLDETLYIYQDNTPGQDIYPIPQYNSALNWAQLDGEISYFMKNNMQNSIFPSIVIKRPKDFGSIQEIDQFKHSIASKTGAGNAGRVLVLTGNGKDDVPEFQQVTANNNDEAFQTSAKECKESIAIAHGLNPSIIGIKTAGQLGNVDEIKTSFAIFEKNVVMPMRSVMEEIFNDLVDIASVPNTVVINNFQLLDGEIVQTEPTNTQTK